MNLWVNFQPLHTAKVLNTCARARVPTHTHTLCDNWIFFYNQLFFFFLRHIIFYYRRRRQDLPMCNNICRKTRHSLSRATTCAVNVDRLCRRRRQKPGDKICRNKPRLSGTLIQPTQHLLRNGSDDLSVFLQEGRPKPLVPRKKN